MRKKNYLKKILRLCIVISILAVLFGTLPEFWLKHRLKNNWNAESTISAEISESKQRPRTCLVFALDGVPYPLIKDLHEQGYFKSFHAPGKLVSTFPSLTRPAFSKMLIGGKPYGYERLYYNSSTNRLEGSNLVDKVFAVKKGDPDYHPKLHFLGFPGYIAYVFPDKFTQTTFDAFESRLKGFQGDEFIAYMGISDAIAHVRGEAALIEFLKQLSTRLETLQTDLDNSLDIVLFSDHGNNFRKNQWVDLSSPLINAGFHQGKGLQDDEDFVLPENGFVSFATIYTAQANARPMAMVLASIQGVDFSVYKAGNDLYVHGPVGIARIVKQNDFYQYDRLTGDPLGLQETVLRLDRMGRSDANGLAHENDWWEATQNHIYPDPLRRIWEGVHDLVQHPGTILVSLKDGYAFGPPIFKQPMINQRLSTHGALLAAHSCGFIMTDYFRVEKANRPMDVLQLLSSPPGAREKQAI